MRVEDVVNERIFQRLYETKMGYKLTHAVLSRKIFSRLYGSYYDSRFSRKKIVPFIKKFNIDMCEFEELAYRSFNDFFVRKFKSGKRFFEKDVARMPAFAEGKYLAFERVSPEQSFPVKGKWITADSLMADPKKSRPFKDGPLLLARLCPTDYHRFHFVDSGTVIDSYRLPGALHSVHPWALSKKGDIFCSNKRAITIQQTDHFGRIAYIEIGAMTVGKIVQHHRVGDVVTRGEEKGYFSYGGSTIVLLGEKGKWVPEQSICQYTRKGLESLVRLGSPIARTTSGSFVLKT